MKKPPHKLPHKKMGVKTMILFIIPGIYTTKELKSGFQRGKSKKIAFFFKDNEMINHPKNVGQHVGGLSQRGAVTIPKRFANGSCQHLSTLSTRVNIVNTV